MLILSRKVNESIVIDGRIIIKILRIDKDNVKLGIQAPAEVSVHRQEIQDLIEKGQGNGTKIGTGATSRPGPAPKPPEVSVPPQRWTPPDSK